MSAAESELSVSTEEEDRLKRNKKKVRKQEGEFTGRESNPPKEEVWMTVPEEVKKSCAQTLI